MYVKKSDVDALQEQYNVLRKQIEMINDNLEKLQKEMQKHREYMHNYKRLNHSIDCIEKTLTKEKKFADDHEKQLKALIKQKQDCVLKIRKIRDDVNQYHMLLRLN